MIHLPVIQPADPHCTSSTSTRAGTRARTPNPAEPVHWLVAVAAPVTRLHAVEAEMLALAMRFFGERAKEPDFEFHGADVFSGRRECRGVSPDARVALYREIAALLPKHGCPVFVRGIDKVKHHARAERNRYDAVHPHTLAFQFLVERMDMWLQKQQPRRPAAHPVLGLVIADEQKEVGRDLVRNFARWRLLGTEIGYRRRTIRYMVDTVHYVPSTDSWLL